MIYYTSDLHLGNANIIQYENRPWKTVEEMNAALIENWNKRVGLFDEVYVLGDFSFKGGAQTLEWLKQLNGYIHLIRGNHDAFAGKFYFGVAAEHQLGAHYTDEGWYQKIEDEGREVILCHFPILYWDGMYDRGTYHLYGHMHSRPNMQHPHKDAFNVGVDVNNYMPVTLDELIRRKDE